jgi:FkbM family methyltransferase
MTQEFYLEDNIVYSTMNRKYYGQCGEDVHIHAKYFPTFRNGVFLEMGAFDGAIYSNTKFFEDSLKWSGVLIEPHPQAFSKLRMNRPKCKLYNFAISETAGEVDFYMNQNGPVSSVKDLTTDTHYNIWHAKNQTSVIKVRSTRLDTILKDAGVSKIDFWSLDVEGGEYEVLKTMDWTIPVYLICIEKQESDRKVLCDEILTANGFSFVETVAHNEIWINDKNRPTV